MTILEAISTAIVAMVFAVALERLLRQYYRKLKDDCSRIEAAQNALTAQKQLIDRILDNENISLSVKNFVIELSEIVPDQDMGYRFAKWIESGMPEPKSDEKADKEADELFDDLRRLRTSNPEAFELTTSALRGALITTMLQWPATARCMQRMSYKLAVELTNEVAKSAARFNHWKDAGQPLAA